MARRGVVQDFTWRELKARRGLHAGELCAIASQQGDQQRQLWAPAWLRYFDAHPDTIRLRYSNHVVLFCSAVGDRKWRNKLAERVYVTFPPLEHLHFVLLQIVGVSRNRFSTAEGHTPPVFSSARGGSSRAVLIRRHNFSLLLLFLRAHSGGVSGLS